MKRRRKRNLFGKRNHYRRPTARKLATGLENLERRALLTGLVGWEVMDCGPGIEKEDVAFEKMSQKRDQGPVEKQVRVNMKKLKLEKNQQERLLKKDRQATFEQADLDFADFEVPSGRDYQQVPGISGDYHFERYDLFPGAWILVVDNEPNEHHHQNSNENGRGNINTFVYDGYSVTVWENPDGSIGEVVIEDDDDGTSSDTTEDGDTTSNSGGNQGTGTGTSPGSSGTYGDTSSSGSDDTTNELEVPPEEGDEDLDPGDPPVTEGEGEDGGEDSGETDDDDDDDDGESDDDDDDEEEDGGNSGGGNESNANNNVVLLPTPLDEIIIEDDTGDDDDSGGGEDEGDDETIECPDPPPGGSAPTHPDC
ncbi:MAG: hypothetical protein VB857_03725 [Pirellulaceae bacterium]